MDANALVIDALPLAVTIAENISRRVPQHVDPQDLRQDAFVGLVQASRRYDATKGVPFGAFARRRARGAVLDGLRREDHLTQRARAQVKAEGSGDAGDPPMQLSDPDQLVGSAVTPEASAAGNQCSRLLREALATLPDSLRVVIVGHYFDGLYVPEVNFRRGSVFHRHESGLQQLREHFEMLGVRSLAEVRL